MNKQIMREAGFGKQVELVEHGFCPFCQKPVSISEFRDQLSVREYRISGICQACQDRVFVCTEDDYEDGM